MNFLENNNFKFTFNRLPNIEFSITEINLPGMSMGKTEIPTPFKNSYAPGTGSLQIEDISFSFNVDENLTNYLELHNWLKDLGTKDSYSGLKSLQDAVAGTNASVVSDATLIILSNKSNPIVEVRFENIFPLSIGELAFSVKDASPTNIVCQASFACPSYKIEVL